MAPEHRRASLTRMARAAINEIGGTPIDLSNTPLGPLFDPSVDLEPYISANYPAMRDWATSHLMAPPKGPRLSEAR